MTAVPRNQRLPLSTPQQRLWFLHQLEPATRPIALPWPIDCGALDAGLLERCFGSWWLVTRCCGRRFTRRRDNRTNDHGADCISVGAGRFAGGARRRAGRAVAAGVERRRPAAVRSGPRSVAASLAGGVGPREHVLLVVVHHLVFDGWSEGVLFQELGQLYEAFARGQPSPLAAFPVSTLISRPGSSGARRPAARDAARAYWQRNSRTLRTWLELPTDYPRPSQPTSAGRTLFRSLSPSLSASLRQFSQPGTDHAVCHAAGRLQCLVVPLHGARRPGRGTAVADRPRTDLEALIGFFANTLVLRTRLSGNPTFRELLERVAASDPRGLGPPRAAL